MEARAVTTGGAPAGWLSRIGRRCEGGLAAWRLRKLAAAARTRESIALAEMGAMIARGTVDGEGATQVLLMAAKETTAARTSLHAALGESLPADRSDYAAVSPWARPLVVVRGLAHRALLRNRIARVEREHRECCTSLATHAVRSGQAELRASIPPQLLERIGAARGQAEGAEADSSRLLEPYGGAALPPLLRHAGREGAALGLVLWSHLRAQLLPRIPALAGLAVGWWFASTFTDSSFTATLHSLGIGHGPKRALRAETHQALSFWLPLGAASVCSYLGSRAAALIRARYGPGTGSAKSVGDASGCAPDCRTDTGG